MRLQNNQSNTLLLSDANKIDEKQLRHEIAKRLIAAGLKGFEADALMDCWAEQWFETPGERVIFLLTREEYDKMCPITIRPRPTNFQRVGLVFTELDTNDQDKVESDD